MKDFLLSQKMNDWILLEFSHLGFIGYYIHTLTFWKQHLITVRGSDNGIVSSIIAKFFFLFFLC